MHSPVAFPPSICSWMHEVPSQMSQALSKTLYAPMPQVLQPISFPTNSELIRLTTPALSSKYKKTPSNRFHGFDCLTITAGMTFFLNSGFPFLTVAITISPTPPAGRRLRRAPIPLTEMIYKFRAPELSAQFMTAPLQSEVMLAFPHVHISWYPNPSWLEKELLRHNSKDWQQSKMEGRRW